MTDKFEKMKAAIAGKADKVQPEVTTEKGQPQKAKAVSDDGEGTTRDGKVSIVHWLEVGFRANLKMLEAMRAHEEPRPLQQDLAAEAYNDLFLKHGLPTVQHVVSNAKRK